MPTTFAGQPLPHRPASLTVELAMVGVFERNERNRMSRCSLCLQSSNSDAQRRRQAHSKTRSCR